MIKYYYTCPRCGRTWVRFIPRSEMKCKFCHEVWKTKGRKGTHSRFSFQATFLWLFWLAVILGACWYVLTYFQVVQPDSDGKLAPVVQELLEKVTNKNDQSSDSENAGERNDSEDNFEATNPEENSSENAVEEPTDVVSAEEATELEEAVSDEGLEIKE